MYARYDQARRQGLDRLRLEIVGQPEFHQLHWEALKDPERSRPLVLDAPMIRSSARPPMVDLTVQPSSTINLLLVTARPHGGRDVGYRTIARPLVESLRQARLPVQVDLVRPGTYRALVEHLERTRDRHGVGYYHLIHFDLHGAVLTARQLAELGGVSPYTYKVLLKDRYARPEDLSQPPADAADRPQAYLFFEGKAVNELDPARADEVADLLQQHHLPIAILNACQSGQQVGDTETSLGSRLLHAGVQTVLAMGYSVTVSAAKLLMATLYGHLFGQDDLLAAVRQARLALYNQKGRRAYFNQQINLEDWLLPVVYQPGTFTPTRLPLRQMTQAEQVRFWSRRERRYQASEPAYGFVGQDVDILQIEQRLLSRSEGKQRNLLLVRGMGGAGKSTLLHHLGQWWQTTGLVQEVFYFGYDEKAYSLAQIMDRVAQGLFRDAPPGLAVSPELSQFRALTPAGQWQRLAQKLRSERHLLILDNLESVTGEPLAIPHTLSPQERTELRRFLANLLDGQTLILLGSRSGAEWLIVSPPKGGTDEGAPLRPTDIYDLPGLDPEAASQLAERILERHVPDPARQVAYRQSAAFQHLLKLLDGYPLPLVVVLSNLAHQPPDEILNALQVGDMSRDTSPPKGGIEEGPPTTTTAEPESKTELLIQTKTRSILHCIEYAHSNLAPAAQKLLLCLFPFTGVINKYGLEYYTKYLKQQTVLADLPFEQWPEVLQAAQDWGLLTQHELPGFLHLQPTLSYFLKTRLTQSPDLQSLRPAIETAFRQHYDGLGDTLNDMLTSNEAREKQIGQRVAGLEYENLYTALRLALAAQVSLKIYDALSNYLDTTHQQQRGLELGQLVLGHLKNYPVDVLSEELGFEMINVIFNIATCQFKTKQLVKAAEAYQEALSILLKNKHFTADFIARNSAAIYLHLGWVAQEQRQWGQAEQYFQQALAIYIEYNDRKGQAAIYQHLGNVAKEQQQWAQAEQSYQQALAICIEINARYEQATIYHNLGVVTTEQQQWTQAEQYFQQALAIKIEYNDRISQARTYHWLGVVAQHQWQWGQVEQYYQQALAIYIEHNDHYEQAATYNQLGRVTTDQRQWAQAEQYYQQALAIYIEYNDHFHQATTYDDLGVVAQKQQQWAQAEQYYQQALAIYIEYNDRYQQTVIYQHLGAMTTEQRQWPQAEQYYQQALAICIEINNRKGQAGFYHNLGVVAQKQQQWAQAEQYYQQALAIYIEQNDHFHQALTYQNLGTMATEQQQWGQAEHYCQQALAIHNEHNDHYGQAIIYNNLGAMAQKQRQWEQAYDYLLKALTLFTEYEDEHTLDLALGNLSRLWQAQPHETALVAVGRILDLSEDEARALLENRPVEGGRSN